VDASGVIEGLSPFTDGSGPLGTSTAWPPVMARRPWVQFRMVRLPASSGGAATILSRTRRSRLGSAGRIHGTRPERVAARIGSIRVNPQRGPGPAKKMGTRAEWRISENSWSSSHWETFGAIPRPAQETRARRNAATSPTPAALAGRQHADLDVGAERTEPMSDGSEKSVDDPAKDRTCSRAVAGAQPYHLPDAVVTARLGQRRSSIRSVQRIETREPPGRPTRGARLQPLPPGRRVILIYEAIANC
jgi:hypothetical protein